MQAARATECNFYKLDYCYYECLSVILSLKKMPILSGYLVVSKTASYLSMPISESGNRFQGICIEIDVYLKFGQVTLRMLTHYT